MLSEICRKCAECCKHYPFVELSQKEVRALGELTGLPFHVFANQKDESVEEYFLEFKENGACFFLDEDDGNYSCAVYAARASVCRNYPSRPVENEVCAANQEMVRRKNLG